MGSFHPTGSWLSLGWGTIYGGLSFCSGLIYQLVTLLWLMGSPVWYGDHIMWPDSDKHPSQGKLTLIALTMALDCMTFFGQKWVRVWSWCTWFVGQYYWWGHYAWWLGQYLCRSDHSSLSGTLTSDLAPPGIFWPLTWMSLCIVVSHVVSGQHDHHVWWYNKGCWFCPQIDGHKDLISIESTLSSFDI